MAVDEDINHYSKSAYEQLQKCDREKIVIIKSNIWEASIDYTWHDQFNRLSIEWNDFLRVFPELQYDETLRVSLKNWFDYAATDVEEISILNRFLWEIRSGCWMSSINQALEIMPDCILRLSSPLCTPD